MFVPYSMIRGQYSPSLAVFKFKAKEAKSDIRRFKGRHHFGCIPLCFIL